MKNLREKNFDGDAIYRTLTAKTLQDKFDVGSRCKIKELVYIARCLYIKNRLVVFRLHKEV